MRLKEKRSRTQEAKEIRRAQREAVSVPLRPTVRPFTLERGEVVDFASLSSSDPTSPSPSPSPDFSGPGTPASHSATPSLLSEADLVPDVMPPQALFHGKSTCPHQTVQKSNASCLHSVYNPDDEELDAEGAIDPGSEYAPATRVSTVFARKKQELIKQEPESEDDADDPREEASKEKGERRKEKTEVSSRSRKHF